MNHYLLLMLIWFGLMGILKAALLTRFGWAPRPPVWPFGLRALTSAAGLNLASTGVALHVLWPFGFPNLEMWLATTILVTLPVEWGLIVLLAPRRAGRGLAAIFLANLVAYGALTGLVLLLFLFAPHVANF